jgi:MHS family proline/betaine transporter-like MFS transporter
LLAVPAPLRYTALPIGYNIRLQYIAVALFGGFSTFLVRVTGNNHTPAAFVIIAATVTLIVLLRTRETAFVPLR